MNKFTLIAISLLCSLCHTVAQEKDVTNARMIGVGYTALQDTYLSPEHYHGVELRYVSHTIRERTDSCRWSRLIINEGNVSRSTSRSGNGATLAGAYHFQYGVLYGWNITDRIKVKAGAQGEVIAGFIYNTRNGNNMAQARLALDFGPVANVSYALRHPDGHRKGVVLNYEASAPLFGLTFSPQYGQSYYEIFSRGNYDHNCVPVTIGSIPSLRQTLTVDFPLIGATWRVGYLGDYRQQAVNSLKQHIYTHALLVGLVYKFKTRKEGYREKM